uniref:Uncharacterized protein n=1 Tax=Anolis carolinensis TaxID=28377 RepID=A0A803TIN9_ANOCA
MNVLPKLLYLFRTIPIIRNNKIFKNWSTELSKFIWQGKKPRVKMLNLTDEKKRGGLGLPDLQLYYEASALGWVKDWATLKDKSMLNLEGFDLRTGWHAYMWYDKKKLEKKIGNHFIRAALIKVWEKYKRNFYTRTPRWISPLEACHRRETPRRNWLTYNDIIRKRERKWTLKSQEEMKKIDQEISCVEIKGETNNRSMDFEDNGHYEYGCTDPNIKTLPRSEMQKNRLVTIKEIYVAEENENDNNDLEENVRMKQNKV